MSDDMKVVNLPDGRAIEVKMPQGGLNLQLKLYYGTGEEKLIPGDFAEPENVHFGFDYFVDLEKYDLLESIIQQLKPSVEDQLRILFAILNYGMPNDCPECAVQAEIIDKRTGQPVVSVKNKEVSSPNF